MNHELETQQGRSALQRGITAARAGLASAAASAFERAAELLPDSPDVWNWLAWTSNSPDNALRCLRRALELAPNDVAAAAGIHWLSQLSGTVSELRQPMIASSTPEPRPTESVPTAPVQPVPGQTAPISTAPIQAASVAAPPVSVPPAASSPVPTDPVVSAPVVSAPVEPATLSELAMPADVIVKADDTEVFQADAVGWIMPEAAPKVELPAPETKPLVEPETASTFPAVVLPPPETDKRFEAEAEADIEPLSVRIAQAVATRGDRVESPQFSLEATKPLSMEAAKPSESAAPSERPTPPPFTPAAARRVAIDPFADDDPRRFSELVRQASQMPLPNRVSIASPESAVKSRFTEMPDIPRPAEFAAPSDEHPILAGSLDTTAPTDVEDAVDLDALTRAFRPALFDASDDGRPVVMVVDDSPTVRKLVSLTLERRGFRVIAAADGVNAIRELGSCRPDLFLLDIAMPRLDGYRLCKLIKKNEVTQHIPVVMLSGKDGLFDKLRGRLVGCTDYITKPFEADALTQKVTKYLAVKTTK